MIFFDVFNEASLAIYYVISTLDLVHINVGSASTYVQLSLLDILEIAFGVKVLSTFTRIIFTKKEEPIV